MFDAVLPVAYMTNMVDYRYPGWSRNGKDSQEMLSYQPCGRHIIDQLVINVHNLSVWNSVRTVYCRYVRRCSVCRCVSCTSGQAARSVVIGVERPEQSVRNGVLTVYDRLLLVVYGRGAPVFHRCTTV